VTDGPRDKNGRRGERGGVSSFQNVLGQYLRQSGLEQQFSNARVYKAWRDALGVALAARARPVRFENGVLEVAVKSAAHLQELSTFTGEGYRKAANRKLGGERIRGIEFRLER
jgi:predicted nucleic acid-binding Zn ribbon protein